MKTILKNCKLITPPFSEEKLYDIFIEGGLIADIGENLHVEDAKELDGIIDVGKDLIDFGQTAAALSNLDIVICNDTSLAHLAGAMGIPCWVILPYEVNWRWHTDLSVCDWYNSVKLFRQHSIGNWQSVFDDILNEMIEA